jgi:hypothetical protein
VQADQRGAEPLAEPECVLEGGDGVLRAFTPSAPSKPDYTRVGPACKMPPQLAKAPRSAMNRAVGRRDEALCEELKELAGRLGVEVREEPLLREVGYHVHSGACRVHGRELIIIERGLSASDRIEVLLRGLLEHDFETHYLSPALRRLIESARGASG